MDRGSFATDGMHDTEVALTNDRGERFDQRIQLFNWGADQLIAAQAGAKIVALPAKEAKAAQSNRSVYGLGNGRRELRDYLLTNGTTFLLTTTRGPLILAAKRLEWDLDGCG